MRTARRKVFISRDLPDIGARLLREAGFDVKVWDQDRPMTQEELIVEASEVDALFCTSGDKINAHFLNTCSHLDIISQYAAGYDNVDTDTASQLGIPIGNTPGAMSESTADIAFGLMIAVARWMFYMHKGIIAGKWDYFRPKANLGIELSGKTLGIFGLGQIGVEMARRCKGAYNMDIIYCNRSHNFDAEKELNARLVDFDTLLRESDVLSVHSVLSDETRGIFNASAFKKMKKTSIFINTSRGGVHNESDLIEALQAGAIWGAGLDVTNPEPMQPDNPLLEMERVAVTPHLGSASVEARDRMATLAANNIISFYENHTVPHLVNPEVLSK